MNAPLAPISSTQDLIKALSKGEMIIVVDDENRENEGDLIVSAQKVTPKDIAFMARFGRGLICLALPQERIAQLDLPLSPSTHSKGDNTAFTISIEAKEGITTGISAPDRCHTIKIATDPSHTKESLLTPGHVFPLQARRGGVLERAGHTEAAVDFSRLAGLIPGGVLCEIMNDDGEMSKFPELRAFAHKHNLSIGTIEDLITYRCQRDYLVKRGEETIIETHAGLWKLIPYHVKGSSLQHVALIKGKVLQPTLVRMHPLNVLKDVLSPPKNSLLHKSMTMIEQAKSGIVVILQTTAGHIVAPPTHNTHTAPAPDAENPLRSYGIGAQILIDLQASSLELLSNSERPLVALKGYGLTILKRHPIL